MACALWVEENLPGTATVIAQFLLQIHDKIFDLENEGQSDGTHIHNDAIQWHTNQNLFLVLDFTISDILAFQIFEIEI